MCAVVLGALLVLALTPVSARAARVTVLDRRGHATVRDDPYVPSNVPTPAAAARVMATTGGRETGAGRAAAGQTVRSELTRLFRAHSITAGAYRRSARTSTERSAKVKHLSSTRGRELEAVVENLHDIAARASS